MSEIRRTWMARLASLCLLGLCWLPPLVSADDSADPGFRVTFAEARLVDQVLRLDAGFDLTLSQELKDAIHNSIPVSLVIEMELQRKRSYWLDETLAHVVQRYEIRYNELTQSYVLDNMNTGVQFSLPSLDVVVAVMSNLRDFPFLDYSLLSGDGTYMGRVRIGVDVDSLPTPLRLLAYVNSDWRLTSDWYTWQLKE